MIGQEKVYETLKALGIEFDYLEHPEAPTIEIARQYWKNLDSTHCKNLFFLKSASNLNGNLNCSKELEHYAS